MTRDRNRYIQFHKTHTIARKYLYPYFNYQFLVWCLFTVYFIAVNYVAWSTVNTRDNDIHATPPYHRRQSLFSVSLAVSARWMNVRAVQVHVYECVVSLLVAKCLPIDKIDMCVPNWNLSKLLFPTSKVLKLLSSFVVSVCASACVNMYALCQVKCMSVAYI